METEKEVGGSQGPMGGDKQVDMMLQGGGESVCKHTGGHVTGICPNPTSIQHQELPLTSSLDSGADDASERGHRGNKHPPGGVSTVGRLCT